MKLFVLQILFLVLLKQTVASKNLCQFCPCYQPKFFCPPPRCPPLFCPPPPRCPPIHCPPPPKCPPPYCPPIFCPPRICPPCPIPVPFTLIKCCKGCKCSMRFKRDSSSVNDLMHEMNPICNNDQLMKIMEKKIGTNATESAFAIKEEADSKLKAQFNVFCAMNDLIYAAHAGNFCQYQKGDIICFAYKF